MCSGTQVCALFERVINAEGSDVDLDQVAAAAMEAVEGAVRDEVEAATVLSATQAALAKTLQDLQALDGESAAARVAEISSALASTDMPAAAVASVDGSSSSKAPSPTADAIQLLDSLTAAGAAAATAAPGGAAATGTVLLQAVDAPSSSNGSGGPATAAAAAAAPVAMASVDSASKAAEQAKKIQVEKAKAKLLKLGGAAVAVGLAYAFLQTAAGQVRRLTASVMKRQVQQRQQRRQQQRQQRRQQQQQQDLAHKQSGYAAATKCSA
jgi:heme exporter protein D